MRLKVRGLKDGQSADFEEWAEGIIGTIAVPSLIEQAINAWAIDQGLVIKYLIHEEDEIDILFTSHTRPCPRCKRSAWVPDNDYVCNFCRDALDIDQRHQRESL